MARIEARDLDPDDIGRLVTVTDDTGESLTMTLHRYARDADGISIKGRCLGHVREVEDMPPWEVLHIYRDEEEPRAVLAQVLDAEMASADRLPPMPSSVSLEQYNIRMGGL